MHLDSQFWEWELFWQLSIHLSGEWGFMDLLIIIPVIKHCNVNLRPVIMSMYDVLCFLNIKAWAMSMF